jgi:phosphate acyltransferase
MRIAVDAMGGDNAPDVNIEGALMAVKHIPDGDTIILVGDETVLKGKIPSEHIESGKIQIVHASEVIGMDESPVVALRHKKDNSISVMAKLAAAGEADAVISAGNTGACVAACQLRMRNLPGVNRPGITIVMPTAGGPVALCDVGANVACKPLNLYQYAVMSSLYMEMMYNIHKPRVGLISVGEEESKGNEIVKKTRDLLRGDKRINFIGNIEGHDLFKGVCDVAVCDGFVGNIILKVSEGLIANIVKVVKEEIQNCKSIIIKLLALKFKSAFKTMFKKYDYHEYGGAQLIGVNGTSIICHGSSVGRSICNAILAAEKLRNEHLNEKIVDFLDKSNNQGAANEQ